MSQTPPKSKGSLAASPDDNFGCIPFISSSWQLCGWKSLSALSTQWFLYTATHELVETVKLVMKLQAFLKKSLSIASKYVYTYSLDKICIYCARNIRIYYSLHVQSILALSLSHYIYSLHDCTRVFALHTYTCSVVQTCIRSTKSHKNTLAFSINTFAYTNVNICIYICIFRSSFSLSLNVYTIMYNHVRIIIKLHMQHPHHLATFQNRTRSQKAFKLGSNKDG